MRKIRVLKFGGTSVDSAPHRELAAGKVLACIDAGYAPVVVVSAIGRRGAPYATDTLIDELRKSNPTDPPAPRELDMMMACGEIISTAVMAVTLQSRGCPAVALSGGQAGIFTDEVFGNARISAIKPNAIYRAIENGQVPVVCGFQGVTTVTQEYDHGMITTLGRGGSDTTASALGAALRADAVEIYTDVDGVKTADPDMVPNAKTHDFCTYDEVAEIAHQGAKVVHPRAAEIAMEHNIPLWVRSTFSDKPGTQIVSSESAPASIRRRITGVTHTGHLAYITLDIENSDHKPHVEVEVYRMMARAGVNTFLTTYGDTSFSFAVSRKMYPVARDVLDGMVVPVATDPNAKPASHCYIFKFSEGLDLAYRNQRPLLQPLEALVKVVDVPGTAFENGSVVSVIANGHREAPGVVSRIFDTLNAAGIPIFQIADSSMSVSCLVPENEVKRAVRLLHDAFALGE